MDWSDGSDGRWCAIAVKMAKFVQIMIFDILSHYRVCCDRKCKKNQQAMAKNDRSNKAQSEKGAPFYANSWPSALRSTMHQAHPHETSHILYIRYLMISYLKSAVQESSDDSIR